MALEPSRIDPVFAGIAAPSDPSATLSEYVVDELFARVVTRLKLEPAVPFTTVR